MAIAAGTIVRVWSMRALDRLIFENPWQMVVDDRSAELGGRESLNITDVKRDITLNARTSNSADFGTIQQPDTQSFRLNTDKFFDWNEAVPILDEMETGPSLAAAVDRWRVNRVVNQISADIRGVVDAATPRDQKAITIAAAADFRGDANVQNVINTFLDRQEYADAIGMPEGTRCAVVAPKIRTAISKYLLEKGTDMGPGLAAATFMGRQVSRLLGWDIAVDRSITGDFANAGTGQLPMYFFQKNRTVIFGQQIRWARVIAHQNAPQNLWQGLLKYGSIVPEEVTVGTTADAYSDVTSDSYAESLMVTDFTVTG